MTDTIEAAVARLEGKLQEFAEGLDSNERLVLDTLLAAGADEVSGFAAPTMRYTGASSAMSFSFSKADWVAFNPQPDPPGSYRTAHVSPGEAQGFNPQPDPPGKVR
jgi:hypothetical protein